MASDTAPPILSGLTISDSLVDMDSGETSFNVTLTVSDDSSGVADGGVLGVFVRFESLSGQIRDASFYYGPTTGNSLNGIYTATITFGPYAEAGVWTASWVTLLDKAGNLASIQKDDSILLQGTTLEVVNEDSDKSAPTLEAISLSRSVVDVGSGPATTNVILHLKDDVSGVAAGGYLGASVRFVSPSGSQFVDATYYDGPTSGTLLDGTYIATISLGPFAENGLWKAEWLLLTDAAGNTASYDNSGALPHGASFTVTGSVSDTTPPMLKSMDVGTGKLKPDGSSEFIISLHLTDDLSGLASYPYTTAEVRFVSASGQIADGTLSVAASGSLDGTYEATVRLSGYAESGVWRVQYVSARDAAGNTAWFTPEDTPFLGAAVIIPGSALPDALQGTQAGDSMFGYGGDDTLNGLGGNDTITGGDGDDKVSGGDGDDSIVGGDGAGNDSYTGGSGTDTVIYKSATKSINVNLNNGKASGAEIGTDKLKAIEGVLGGRAGDKLIGNQGSNIIDGYYGKDKLIGGPGKDTFKFSTEIGKGNVDAIKDFRPKDDTILLDNSVFGELAVGGLTKSAFRIGKAAKDGDDRVIYDEVSGRLFFDPDGEEAGKAILFAKVTKNVDVTYKDFLII